MTILDDPTRVECVAQVHEAPLSCLKMVHKYLPDRHRQNENSRSHRKRRMVGTSSSVRKKSPGDSALRPTSCKSCGKFLRVLLLRHSMNSVLPSGLSWSHSPFREEKKRFVLFCLVSEAGVVDGNITVED